jgi:hypothetical protein
MSCCGKARNTAVPNSTVAAKPTSPSGGTVVFEYTGRTALTIIGPGSRTSYRFDRPGARMLVDGRDRASLAGVPVLRQVSA